MVLLCYNPIIQVKQSLFALGVHVKIAKYSTEMRNAPAVQSFLKSATKTGRQ